ncbi:unnamed protein product [Cylicocyclus nassatus]|uniref:Cystatin domain-containing protein n=1 Tax=Cylicocyclus nassatus TaxID=53992 RepID=A0AA36GVU2_CYLNA|nr:unnamed protein product [Cylicocyclus nassatus]
MSCHTIVFALFCTFAITHCSSMPGGKVDQNPTDKKFMQIAWKAAKTLNEDRALNPGPNAMMPIKVLRAQSQVVAGVIYNLEVLYGESGCRLGGVDLSRLQYANCRVMNNWKKAVYKIRYYSKPWENYEQIKVWKA